MGLEPTTSFSLALSFSCYATLPAGRSCSVFAQCSDRTAFQGPRVLHFTSFLSLQPSPSCSRLCITAEYRLCLDPLGEVVHELIPSSLSNASFLERNKQAARACRPVQMFGITFTSLLHCMHFGGSQLMWNAASSVRLPPPLQGTSLPQLYVSIPLSCLAVFLFPFLLLTSIALLEKRVALEATVLQNFFATSVKLENRPLLRAVPGYLNLETQSQSDTSTDGVGM